MDLPKIGKPCGSASIGENGQNGPSKAFELDPLSSLCSRPSSGPSRFLSPIDGSIADEEEAVHPSVLAGREQNLRCGLVVADLNKRGVAECFEEYGLRDYFDEFGQRRFSNLSMSVAARRHPQVSKAFGSTAQHIKTTKEAHLFSAIAYRKASAMIEQDRQAHRERKEVQFRGLASAEKYRTSEVARRQLQLIRHGFPPLEENGLSFLPQGMTEEVMLPLEPSSRQQERDNRKRSERHNVYLAERNPQTVFLVKRQGWVFNYDDVQGILEKLEGWMGAVALTPIWGIDRSTFSQLLVDLNLRDKDRLPYIWAHQVFDAYAKPTRLAAGDPDYDDTPEGRARSAWCVSRWDFIAVLDRLLRTRFELSPREEFLSRLKAAHGQLRREWRTREDESRTAAQAAQLRLQSWKQSNASDLVNTNGSDRGKNGKMKEEECIRESQRWKFDRHACCMMKEPEVMQIVEQFRHAFTVIFESYASETKEKKPHMNVKRAYQAAILVERQEVSLASSLTSDLSTLSVPRNSKGQEIGRSASTGRAKPKATSALKEAVRKRAFGSFNPPKNQRPNTMPDGLVRVTAEVQAAEREKGKPVFGVAAFVECLCRLVIGHLLVYGNSLQQTISPEARVVWLVSYLVEVLRQGRSTPQHIAMPDWPGWRSAAWRKMLERLQDEDFTNAPRPNGQAPPIDAEDESTQSADEVKPQRNSETEDEGEDSKSEVSHRALNLPSFAKDAPEATGWLFARLLVCPFDLSAKKKRASEKVRRTNSEYF
ncbi:unnamed protein product [Durusdinium trenchii]|uniref:Uncharacterized protein n=1 Tax=Durusdinium trenchii TaxID=1381693 RepID=A0ABP0JZF3_9DINO